MTDPTVVTEKITAFLDRIGISAIKTKITQDTFLPGIIINKGTLEYDPALMKYPGDLLHEAGHIAVLAPQDRKKVAGDLRDYQTPSESDELGAILWSYAALTYLNIAPEIVFHENGYKNDSQWLIDQFENGTYIGLPYLEWKGITDQQTFPKVHHWLAQ